MEKLVLLYEQGDGCSWSATDTIPFEYNSKLEAELELLRLWEEYQKNKAARDEYLNKNPVNIRQVSKNPTKLSEWKKYVDDSPPYVFTDINFAGHTLDVTNFSDEKGKYLEPQIFELNEWFELNKNGN
jgi:hypothetical protein